MKTELENGPPRKRDDLFPRPFILLGTISTFVFASGMIVPGGQNVSPRNVCLLDPRPRPVAGLS